MQTYLVALRMVGCAAVRDLQLYKKNREKNACKEPPVQINHKL